MDKKAYGQLGLKERIEIYRLHADGKSARFIAKVLGRCAGTVSRELRRNGRPTKQWQSGYDPARAQELAKRRRWRGRGYKLELQPELRKLVLDQLAMDRSPEQIAGRLKLEQGKPVISYESIYRYIYWRSWSFNEKLHLLLPRKKYRRGRGRERHRWSKDAIKQRVSIHDRPNSIGLRKRKGHWEADLMAFSDPGHNILVMHERVSRLTLVRRHNTRVAEDTAKGLSDFIARLKPGACKSITFDNGPEFASHFRLREKYRIQTWFCDTHSPWQKGGVENAIGRLRKHLPRMHPCKAVLQRLLPNVLSNTIIRPESASASKHPPRSFLTKVLHFKRESTPSLRSG